MQSRLIDDSETKTWAIVFDKGDEFVSGMQQFAEEMNLDSARFTAIGAFSDVVLQFFDRQKMEYKKIPVSEQAEVLALEGNIALDGQNRKVHAHGVIGLSDASTRGGHIGEAHVWPTLEVVLEEAPAHLKRTTEQETGLALLNLKA
jgi:predicted DNA-binding protein with PD1-like motif